MLPTLSVQRLRRSVNHKIYFKSVLSFLTCFHIYETLGHVAQVYEHLCTDTKALCLSRLMKDEILPACDSLAMRKNLLSGKKENKFKE